MRLETAQAFNQTGLAVLKRADFMKVLRKCQKKEDENTLGFVRNIPFFQNLSQNQMKKLMNISEEMVVTRHQYVVN